MGEGLVGEQAYFVEQLSKPCIHGAQVVIVKLDLLQQAGVLLFRESLLPLILLHLAKYSIFLEVLTRQPVSINQSCTTRVCTL